MEAAAALIVRAEAVASFLLPVLPSDATEAQVVAAEAAKYIEDQTVTISFDGEITDANMSTWMDGHPYWANVKYIKFASNVTSIGLKAFNNQFEEFLEDVEMLFPNNRDIKTSKTGLLMLRKANPKKIVSVWYRYVCLKYEVEIENENLDYFLTKDYSSDLKMDEGASDKVMEGIDKIREPLRQLDPDNRKKTIQYLKNLNQLSKIYNN
jgi:hypothetical protein